MDTPDKPHAPSASGHKSEQAPHHSDNAYRETTSYLLWKDSIVDRFVLHYRDNLFPVGPGLTGDAMTYLVTHATEGRLRIWYNAGESVRGAMAMLHVMADAAIKALQDGPDETVGSAVRASAKAIARARRPKPVRVELLFFPSRTGKPRCRVVVDGRRRRVDDGPVHAIRQEWDRFLHTMGDFHNAGGTWGEDE